MFGNYIGLNAGRTGALPNGDNGIFVFNAQDIQIGGFDPGAGNVISGNLDHGITIIGFDSTDIEIGSTPLNRG